MSKKIYINLADDVIERVDDVASKFGVSRSAYLAMLIGQSAYATEQSLKMIPTMAQAAVKEISTEK